MKNVIKVFVVLFIGEEFICDFVLFFKFGVDVLSKFFCYFGLLLWKYDIDMFLGYFYLIIFISII